jgi:hypothetical protein
MDGWVDIFHLLHSLFDGRFLENWVAIVFPNPIPAELFQLRLDRVLLDEFFDLDLLDFRLFFDIA